MAKNFCATLARSSHITFMALTVRLEIPQLDRLTECDITNVEIRERLEFIERQLQVVLEQLNRIVEKGAEMADTLSTELESLRQEVERNNQIDQSAGVLLQGLSNKLDQALASGNIETVRAFAAQLRSSNDALAAAITANTPKETGAGEETTAGAASS
jgi:hypothetical protein